jgi:hypothetical protein
MVNARIAHVPYFRVRRDSEVELVQNNPKFGAKMS